MSAFDPAAATAAYLALLPPEAHAKAQAYTQGGHWLLLWGALASLVASVLIIRSDLLTVLRQRLEAHKPRPVAVSFALSFVYVLISALITLPWDIYAQWWREKAYGLNNQTLPQWLGEAAIMVLISAAATGLFLMALYALIHRAPKTWWLWSGGLTGLFLIVTMVVVPVAVDPLFNDYVQAPPGAVRTAVVTLAKANGVPSDKVFVYNGSKQSDRYTANVSGLFGTARVAISDSMLKRATLPEVRGVVGHEIGHYVHQHSLWIAGAFSLIGVVMFWLIHRLFDPACRWMGAAKVQGLADPAGLPVLNAIVTVFLFLATPVTNSVTRIIEADADAYSLTHVGEPDGLSSALVKTIEYRAATPSVLEEVIFYDHPAVGRRIARAMVWKAAHPPAVQP